MAHFARVVNDVVDNVIVIDNEHLLDQEGAEQEALGLAYLHSIGLLGTWVQTSYNGSFRGAYAGIGMIWDGVEFVPSREALSADVETIPADGTSAAAVTYRNRLDGLAAITFDVNGAEVSVDLTDGIAVLEVTASTPGLVEVSLPERPEVPAVTVTAVAP